MLQGINPALVPSAAYAVVPRTSTATAGASADGGQPAVGAQDDDMFSDPESSLYDYQNMEDAG